MKKFFETLKSVQRSKSYPHSEIQENSCCVFMIQCCHIEILCPRAGEFFGNMACLGNSWQAIFFYFLCCKQENGQEIILFLCPHVLLMDKISNKWMQCKLSSVFKLILCLKTFFGEIWQIFGEFYHHPPATGNYHCSQFSAIFP